MSAKSLASTVILIALSIVLTLAFFIADVIDACWWNLRCAVSRETKGLQR